MEEHGKALNAEAVQSTRRRKCSPKVVGIIVCVVALAMLTCGGLALRSVLSTYEQPAFWRHVVPSYFTSTIAASTTQSLGGAPDTKATQTRMRASASQRLNSTVRFDPTGAYFVFLGVYEIAPTIYHSGVIVCAKSDFEPADEDDLIHMLTCNSDTAIPGSDNWWSCWHSNMYTCGSHCCCDGGYTWDNDGNCVSPSSIPYLEVGRSFWSTRHVPCKILEYGLGGDSTPCSGTGIQDTTFDSDASLRDQHFTNDYVWKFIYGTSNMDGQTVYDDMCEGAKNCPECIQWSGDDYNLLGPNCNTYTSCTTKCGYGMSGDQPSLLWSSMMSCECV